MLVLFFRLQQNRMLAELQGRSIYELHPGEGEKERRLAALTQEVDYLHPRRHRYFCKPYRIDPQLHEIPLLLNDMDDYRQLLSTQTKKLLAYLHDYQLDTSLNALIAAILRYFEQFSLQGYRMAGRLGKRQEVETRREGSGEGRCSECLRMLSEYRVQQMREELQLNRFEDHYKLFNVDHLNFQELGRLQRESKALLQGELAEENQFIFQGGCISLEQYEEVLNLLGSDLHQKNASIEKIIDYLNKTDRRLLGEDRVKDREGEEQMRQFDAIVTGNSIQERLRDMMRQFMKRYLKYKMYKRKDADCQVNFKENEVIRELEREKKHLKHRIYTITTEKQRMAIDYQNRLKALNLMLETNAAQFRQQMEKNALEAAQTAQLFAQERHLHDLHKIELEHLTNDYAYALALLNRTTNKEKDLHSSKSSKRTSSRKSKKEKPKVSQKRQRSSFAEISNTNIESDNEMDSANTLQMLKGKEESRKSIFGEGRGINSSLNDIARMDSYSKIEERQEEEENEAVVVPKQMKRKTSRFKVLMSHFNSNATLQQEVSKPRIQSSQLASINAIPRQLSHEEPHQDPFPEQSLPYKLSQESRYQMLLKLFESERSSQQLSLPFPNFLQLYNNFITTISSEKLLRRSNSLKPRVNRLGSNHQSSYLYRTAKSIDEQLTKENGRGRGKVERKSNSSKLEPIDKKSQYCLKKVRKSKQFEFKNYSRTAQPTLRKDISQNLLSIKDVQIESSNLSEDQRLYPSFTDQDLQDIFLGQAKKIAEGDGMWDGRQEGKEEASPAENKFLMKVYSEMANLHIKNLQDYLQVKTVLCHPQEAVARHPVSAPRKENINELKNALRSIIKLHRKCNKDKAKSQCPHLQKFIAKIGQLCAGTSLKLIDNVGGTKLA